MYEVKGYLFPKEGVGVRIVPGKVIVNFDGPDCTEDLEIIADRGKFKHSFMGTDGSEEYDSPRRITEHLPIIIETLREHKSHFAKPLAAYYKKTQRFTEIPVN